MLYMYDAKELSFEVCSVRTPSCGCCVKLRQIYRSTSVLTHGFLSVHWCNSAAQLGVRLAGFSSEFQSVLKAAKTSKNLEVMP